MGIINMAGTKEKYNEIQNDAMGIINGAGGIDRMDKAAADYPEAWRYIMKGCVGRLMLWHGITPATAKRHLKKAAEQLRSPQRTIEDNWGGARYSKDG